MHHTFSTTNPFICKLVLYIHEKFMFESFLEMIGSHIPRNIHSMTPKITLSTMWDIRIIKDMFLPLGLLLYDLNIFNFFTCLWQLLFRIFNIFVELLWILWLVNFPIKIWFQNNDNNDGSFLRSLLTLYYWIPQLMYVLNSMIPLYSQGLYDLWK